LNRPARLFFYPEAAFDHHPTSEPTEWHLTPIGASYQGESGAAHVVFARFLAWSRIVILASHSHDTSKKAMCRAICERRRAIAEWHGCARIHGQLQNIET
jgi:hypothetical protein